MLKTLPYTALRTLESVVRLRGFSRAAEELNVTQSAVSQHVKQLEEWLGNQLIVRQSPKIRPTENGELLARAVSDGFGMIETVCDSLRETPKAHKSGLLVAAPPGFAFVWLLHRLLDFDEKHPGIPVSLSTDPKSQNPATSDADVIISYSAGGFPLMHAEVLMTEAMAPVCSPKIAESLRSITDLANYVILKDDLASQEHQSNWEFWSKETGISLPPFARTRKYGQANMVIQAAINGSGIAIGRGPLVENAVQNGALVYPFEKFAASQNSYWFVCHHDALKSKKILAFRTWIQQEAKLSSKHMHAPD
jgi:LysR family glycine cleavage system transcriptional activator